MRETSENIVIMGPRLERADTDLLSSNSIAFSTMLRTVRRDQQAQSGQELLVDRVLEQSKRHEQHYYYISYSVLTDGLCWSISCQTRRPSALKTTALTPETGHLFAKHWSSTNLLNYFSFPDRIRQLLGKQAFTQSL